MSKIDQLISSAKELAENFGVSVPPINTMIKNKIDYGSSTHMPHTKISQLDISNNPNMEPLPKNGHQYKVDSLEQATQLVKQEVENEPVVIDTKDPYTYFLHDEELIAIYNNLSQTLIFPEIEYDDTKGIQSQEHIMKDTK